MSETRILIRLLRIYFPRISEFGSTSGGGGGFNPNPHPSVRHWSPVTSSLFTEKRRQDEVIRISTCRSQQLPPHSGCFFKKRTDQSKPLIVEPLYWYTIQRAEGDKLIHTQSNKEYYSRNVILCDASAKLWTATIGFVLSNCPSLRIEQLAPAGQIIVQHFIIFRRPVEKIQVSLTF
jgi:hypothetical protein